MGLVRAALVVALAVPVLAQQPARPVVPVVLPPIVAVTPIAPPKHPLPPENASARTTRFSFIVYGDTRSGTAGPTGDGSIVNPLHERVVQTMLDEIRARAKSRTPVRFILQTGDAVLRAFDGRMWNVSYTPTIEQLTRGADMPYFLTAGNHDVWPVGAGDPAREQSLHNTLSAMSRLIPPEGSPRRLNGYLTYAFGYGPMFVIAVDTNVGADPVQLAWATDQLEHLDRRRFPLVVAFIHHPAYSSGPHNATLERPTLNVREIWMPLFRKYHVRLIAAGHEHYYEHWVEHYTDAGTTYRMDTIITGGGGAPTYTYRRDPDLAAYLAAGAAQQVRVERLVKPGTTAAENPNHFVVITVDGDRLSEEIIAAGKVPYAPFNGQSRIDLRD